MTTGHNRFSWLDSRGKKGWKILYTARTTKKIINAMQKGIFGVGYCTLRDNLNNEIYLHCTYIKMNFHLLYL